MRKVVVDTNVLLDLFEEEKMNFEILLKSLNIILPTENIDGIIILDSVYSEIEKLKKDIVLIQKRRVCNDFFIMLDNKVPVKTERIGEEKYKEIRMEETALNFSIKDLNNFKKITDTITEIYNEIEKKVNKFEIHPRKSDNLKFKIFEKFLNEIENKMKDDEIKKIHQYLENKLDNLIEGWENIPFEKTSNFTQIFNKMIYYDIYSRK